MIAALFLALSSISATADNRAETKSTCHFAPDPADDDNEIYGSVCKNSIETYDAGDGQGRLGYMETWAYHDYNLNDGAYPKSLGGNQAARRGADAVGYETWHYRSNIYIPYVETPNTECAFVTHNYANGADNYTVYATNDYNVEYWWTGPDESEYYPLENKAIARLNMHMVCRGGVPQQ